MTHSFRIRVNLSKSDGVNSDENSIKIPDIDQSKELLLRNPNDDRPLSEASRLVLAGAGYTSDMEARVAGDAYLNALLFCLAKARVGIDFGARGQMSSITHEAQNIFNTEFQARVLNDSIGLMTFASDPRPLFFGMEGTLGIRKDANDLVSEVAEARLGGITFTDRELLSLSFFNASFFQPEEEGRFVMLVMAVEALLTPAPRASDALDHVLNLIEATKKSDLPSDEKSSILGSLNWLKNESIGKTGQRLASSKLGQRTYNNLSPSKFFSACYELRSRLVHGHTSLDELRDVSTMAAQLEVFVSDLLTVGKFGNEG